MLLSLVISWVVTTNPRVLYEEKCLYCHSEEVTLSAKRTSSQWRGVVMRMRAKSPVMITRSDARVLTQYLVKTLKWVPPARIASAPPPPPPSIAIDKPAQPVEPPNEASPPEQTEETSVTAPELAAAQSRDDQEGVELMQHLCSRCHNLVRVFSKLDSYERSAAILSRMRLKTGSGITRTDAQRLDTFLRNQFDVP